MHYIRNKKTPRKGISPITVSDRFLGITLTNSETTPTEFGSSESDQESRKALMKAMAVYEILRDQLWVLWKYQKTSELHQSKGGSKDYLYQGRDSAIKDIFHGTCQVKDKEKAYWPVCKAVPLEKVGLGRRVFKKKIPQHLKTVGKPRNLSGTLTFSSDAKQRNSLGRVTLTF